MIQRPNGEASVANAELTKGEKNTVLATTAIFSWLNITHPISCVTKRVAGDLRLFVENHVQQRRVNFDAAIVFDEAQFAESVHEKAYARAGRPDHFGEGLLADFREYRLRFP